MSLRKTFWSALLTTAVVASSLIVSEPAAADTHATASATSAVVKRADFRGASVSRDVQHIAQWAVHSGDHAHLPFIVVDKINAVAVAFDAAGRLIRTTPVLIGMGVG